MLTLELDRMRFYFRRTVIAPPPGLTVWLAWDNGTTEGPEPVIALGFNLQEGSVEVEGTRESVQLPNGKQRTVMSYEWTPDQENAIGDDERGFAYTTVEVFTKLSDPTDPWLKLGESVFWTEEQAKEAAAEKLKKWNAAS